MNHKAPACDDRICCRMSRESMAELERRARRNRHSRHKEARQLIERGLTADTDIKKELSELRRELAELQDKLDTVSLDIREEIVTTTVLLLVYAGKLTKEEADSWRKRAFGRL